MGNLSKVTKNVDGIAYPYEFPVYYEYTVGKSGKVFLDGLKKGRITGAKCPECGKVFTPVRIYCEECFEEITEFPKLPNTGTVETFTVVAHDIHGKPFKSPKTAAFVRIDDSCGGFFAFIEGDVEIGDAVKAVFKPVKQRTGAMEDIVGFKPV